MIEKKVEEVGEIKTEEGGSSQEIPPLCIARLPKNAPGDRLEGCF